MDEFYSYNSGNDNGENKETGNNAEGVNNNVGGPDNTNTNQTYGAAYTPSGNNNGEYHFKPYSYNAQENPYSTQHSNGKPESGPNYGGPKKPKKGKNIWVKTLAVTLAILVVIGALAGVAVGIINYAADKFITIGSGLTNKGDDTAITTEADFGKESPVDYSDTKIRQSDASSSSISGDGLIEVVPQGQKLTLEEAVKSVKDAVVEIQTEVAGYSYWYGSYVTTGAGSGVIISADGKIITNHHVIEGAEKIKVRLDDGTEFSATLIATDEEADIAVLSIEPGEKKLTAAILGNSDSLNLGQSVFVIGNPLGELGGSVSAGIISATKREIAVDEIGTMTLIQTDAAVNPGNSGGGLFNLYGELVGVINSKYSESGIEGLGFAIPMNDALSVAQDLMIYGYVRGRVVKGLSGLTLKDETVTYSYSTGNVVVISAVSGNSKFKVGDIITAIGNVEVDSVSDVKRVLRQIETGSTVKVYIQRQVKNGPFSQTQTGYLEAEVYEVESAKLE